MNKVGEAIQSYLVLIGKLVVTRIALLRLSKSNAFSGIQSPSEIDLRSCAHAALTAYIHQA